MRFAVGFAVLATFACAAAVAGASAQTVVPCPQGCDVEVRPYTLTPTPPGPTFTPTLVPPTFTPTPTAMPSGHPNHWHPPTTHEHGDEPPQWATDFSIANFGHGVIYGGNERSSPAENAMKHEAFKGVILQTPAGGEVYWRYHGASNPMDRSAQFHSFEVYYRDAAGGLSFFEGHYDAGDPSDPARRAVRSAPDPGVRPIILVVDEAAWAANIRGEQWYMHSGVGITFALHIINPTTYYGGLEENATAHDMSTWHLTGGLGTVRAGGSTEVFITEGLARVLAGTYCANAYGGRGACDEDHPMRWVIAPTLADDLRLENTVWRISTIRVNKSYSCPACVVPN